MKYPLSRLLRLRSLLEDISRTELEAQLQESARIESALAQLEENDQAMRRQAFEGIIRAENADRVEAESIREWTARKITLLNNVRERKLAEVSVARTSYLERRKECGQVRSVIENGDAAAALKRARREQQELDDWFGQRNR